VPCSPSRCHWTSSARRWTWSAPARGSNGTSARRDRGSAASGEAALIAVTGEALIDLVTEQDGRITAQPGGGPFNTARTIGRLGLAPVFLGRLSEDRFGGLLRARLDADGVTIGVPQPSEAPTTLAAVDVDAAGVARYRFYMAGTAAAALDYSALSAALPAGVTALHAGSLALVMQPAGPGIERLIEGLPPGTLVMIDPNCRPEVIADRDAYRARLSRIFHRADVVKVSVEDLAYLVPGVPARAAATTVLGHGPALVLVTDGPRTAMALMPEQEVRVDVPKVEVVDTIGAGDAFGGAFLAWWSGNGLTRSELGRCGPVREALRAAAEVASLTCTRAGAEPPWLAEVQDRPGWQGNPKPTREQPAT
jgi:fructokinase